MNYLDKLLYPIMMSIRSLRNHFKSEQEANCIILDCQSKVEQFVFSTMHFILDLIVHGPNHSTLVLNKSVFNMKREFQNKIECIQQFVQKGNVKQLISDIQQFYEAQEGYSESESEGEDLSLQIKLTGKIKEFNPEIQSLKQELEKKEEIIQQLKQKLKYRQNSMETMAHNHHKEVSVLKAQFLLNPQPEDGSSIFNVKYFDSTSMLEPEVIAMMNEKINDIKFQYEKYVKQCMEMLQKQRASTPVQQEQIKPIEEYTTKELLKFALDKEQDPYMIIKNIQDLKTINYILNVLTVQQKKYGIDYDKINQTFKANNQDLQKLVDSRLLMEDCQSQISAQYLAELQKKKQEMFEINQLTTQREIDYKEQIKQLEETIKQQDNNQKLNEMILSQQEKMELLRNDNYNLNTMLINQKQYQQQLKQQQQFLMNNLKHVFGIIYPKYKNNVIFDKMDLVKDKTSITKDILQKVNNLDGYELYTVVQEIQLLLYQSESIQIVNQIANGRLQNKQTQTIYQHQEQQTTNVKEKKQKEKKENKPFFKHLEQFNQKKIRQQKLRSVSTQTEEYQTNSILFIEDDTKRTPSISLNTLLKKYQTNQFKDSNAFQLQQKTQSPDPFDKSNSVFEKLYTQQRSYDPRWHQLKPLIEKLSEEEFFEVINTLEIYSFRQQQQNTQNTALDIPQYDISLIQKSIASKSFNRKRDLSVDQTKNVFIELDEQRENALRLYEQQRIDTYRRRIKRLVPVQPSSSLQVEEKIRPKSQFRGSSLKN